MVQLGEAEAGAVATVTAPREISPDELVHQDPWVNVFVVNAIEVAKREVGEALHPIRVLWFWQTNEDRKDEALAQLRLSDDTGSFGEGFSLQQLKDESLMRDRIRRLYRELLEYRSRSLVMNLLRMKVGTGKE